MREETIRSPPFFFLNHRICRPHPRCQECPEPSALCIPGNTAGEPLAAAAHWLRKGLTAYNPSDGHPVCRAGPQEYHYSPRSDHGGKPAAGGPAPFGARIPGSFPGERWSLGAAALAARVSWRSRRVRSRSRECTCCAGYSVFMVPPRRQARLALLCFRKFVNSIIVCKHRPVNTI